MVELTNRSRSLAAALALSVVSATPSSGQVAVTDPVGYFTVPIIGTGGANAVAVKNLLPNAFSERVVASGRVASVEGNRISGLSGSWPADTFSTKPYSHYVEMRSGNAAGAILEIADSEATSVDVARLPEGALAAGDEFVIRPNPTIDSSFGVTIETVQLLTGESPLEADNIVLFDPGTKTQRVFYFHASEFINEWREIGQPGEKGDTTIRFPLSTIIIRRAAEDFDYVQFGHVPYWRSSVARLPVWPGQNLLGLPLTHSTLDSSNMSDPGSPFSVIQGANATTSDVLIISDGRTAERFDPVYFRESAGWRRVGQDGDAGGWMIPMASAMEFNRVGDSGWIQFQTGIGDGPGGAIAARARPAAGVSETFVEGVSVTPRGTGRVALTWPTKSDGLYQLQRMATGTGQRVWIDDGGPIDGTGTPATVERSSAEGGAYFRVTKLQD